MEDHLRLSDADRIHALQALSNHFTDGRLDNEEFDERTRQVTAARVIGDLRPLFADLPDGLPFEDDPEGTRALVPRPLGSDPSRALATQESELREMQQIKQRGKKVEALDGVILGVTLVSFLILQFVIGWGWAWIVWPSLALTMSLPRLIYRFNDADEKTYEELKKAEEKERKARVEHAAKRLRELEEGH